jgi:hypothetical protein
MLYGLGISVYNFFVSGLGFRLHDVRLAILRFVRHRQSLSKGLLVSNAKPKTTANKNVTDTNINVRLCLSKCRSMELSS